MGQRKQATESDAPFTLALDKPLRVLTPWQIQKIDEALAGLGPFAEVRLLKNKGKLRFIQKMESESMLGPSFRTTNRRASVVGNFCQRTLPQAASDTL